MSEGFLAFWAAYPKRKGPNPKHLARTRWDKAIKLGAEPELIVNGAKAYRDEVIQLGQIGTEFVCHASTWLNQRRWEDYAPDPGGKERQSKIDQDMAARGWKWTGEKWEKSFDGR